MFTIPELIQQHKLAIANMRKTHATAATSAKRQITALIKQHERTIKVLQQQNKETV